LRVQESLPPWSRPHAATPGGSGGHTGEFRKLLYQEVVLENLILTGLRGTGKTVLLDRFKPLAIEEGWRWVGTDLSESTSLSEERIALRLITDLAIVTSSMILDRRDVRRIGFQPAATTVSRYLDFSMLTTLYQATPGLVLDKLKTILDLVWSCMKDSEAKGIIFAYDEAQNLADHADANEYPLSLLLDLFQSIQKRNVPFLLALVGLPTLFPNLAEARTFAERMFHVLVLDRLSEADSKDAIVTPLRKAECPQEFFIRPPAQELIVQESGGYPYFIQFICREVLDAFMQQSAIGKKRRRAPVGQIIRKLDTDFFSGRWSRATDRQRDLLVAVAHLDSSETEFTIQEAAEKSADLAAAGVLEKAFAPSRVNQIFGKLAEAGLIFKNRHGRYSFAVPLLSRYIRRQIDVGS
jgi:hypothetical protein